MTDMFSYYEELDRLVTEIQVITGYTLDELKAKFLEGWELTPPKKVLDMIDLEKMIEKGESDV